MTDIFYDKILQRLFFGKSGRYYEFKKNTQFGNTGPGHLKKEAWPSLHMWVRMLEMF